MELLLMPLVENSKSYTVSVAEAMPDSLDSYKPSHGSWTFREQLNHIAYGIEWWTDNLIKGIKTPWEPPLTPESRKETMDYLDRAYAILIKEIKTGIRGNDRIMGLFATLDHITHHRGQLIVYLRQHEIVPPEYS